MNEAGSKKLDSNDINIFPNLKWVYVFEFSSPDLRKICVTFLKYPIQTKVVPVSHFPDITMPASDLQAANI